MQLKRSAKSIQQQVEIFLGWTAASKINVSSGKPYLKEAGGKLALHFDQRSIQSEMSIEMPDKLVLSYCRAMMSFLLFEPAPTHIAMVGLGGGSLAKYCYRHLPYAEITVVEINPDVIALRNEFAIPADDTRFKVRLADGATYVKNTVGRLDVLMLDGYDESGLPDQLSSQQFYDDCFASLADNGIMVANLWGSNARYPEYLARIQNSFSERVVVMGLDDCLCKIVFAVKTNNFPPSSNEIRQHAHLLGLSHPMNFQKKSKKLIDAFLQR